MEIWEVNSRASNVFRRSFRSPPRSPRLSGLLFALEPVIGPDIEEDNDENNVHGPRARKGMMFPRRIPERIFRLTNACWLVQTVQASPCPIPKSTFPRFP